MPVVTKSAGAAAALVAAGWTVVGAAVGVRVGLAEVLLFTPVVTVNEKLPLPDMPMPLAV